MDVNSYWPTGPEMELYHSWRDKGYLWTYLFELRQETWNGFAEIEKTKGVVKPTIPLSTPYGQEVLRIILFRILEEASESFMAQDITHVKEELIDALNYLMSVFLLDSEEYKLDRVTELFTEMSEEVEWGSELSYEDLGKITMMLGGQLADRLRNRAWMNNAQDFYFSGWNVLGETLIHVAQLLMSPFENLDDFLGYYVAKDRVLQFRLKSQY